MNYHVKINGTVFEVVNESTKEGQAIINRFEHPYKRYKDIYEAYDYPSKRKVDIWNEWYDWFKNLPKENKSEHEVIAWDIFIGSRCTSNFTISAMLTKGTRTIYLYITRDHNKAVIV